MPAPLKINSGQIEQFQSGDTLNATNGYFTGTLGVGTAPDGSFGLKFLGTLSGSSSEWGLYLQPTFNSSATFAGYGIYVIAATAATSFTQSSTYGLYVDNATKGSGSTITTNYGIFVATPTAGSTNYSMYVAGGLCHLGGNLDISGNAGIGATSVSDIGLYVQPTLTGNTTEWGLYLQPTFNSSATSAGYGMYLQSITAASSFTQTNTYGLYVDNAAKGSGSTITNNYGVYINTPTAGGTNYSLYAAGGTSYFGGKVGVGNTAPSNTVCIGTDLGSITGSSCLTIGDATQPTFVIGKDSSNYAYMIFGSNGLTINTDQSSSFSTNTIVVNSGKVGIAGITPSEVLTVNGNASVTKLANGQKLVFDTQTESLTIAAAASTNTAFNIPAAAVVLGVSVRVTTVIPTAATFTVTGATSGTTFNTAAVSTALNSTDPGTAAGAYYNASAQHVKITPNLQPSGATGVVRVTCHYYSVTAPTS